MAEAEKDEKKEGAEAAPPPAKSNKMLFIIIGLVVLAAAGAGTFFMMKGQTKKSAEELAADAADHQEGLQPQGAGEEEPLEEGEEAQGAIFPLDTFVVNLSGGRYLRVQFQVEFMTRDIPQAFYKKVVPIRDEFIAYLTKKTADDVLSDKGKDNIKREAKDIINEILKKEEIKKVYFTQYIVN